MFENLAFAQQPIVPTVSCVGSCLLLAVLATHGVSMRCEKHFNAFNACAVSAGNYRYICRFRLSSPRTSRH